MIPSIRPRLAAAALLALLVACATPSPEDAIKPVIKTIAIVPATEPQRVTFESRSTASVFIPVLGLLAASEAKKKQAEMTATLQVGKLSLADKLTQQVAADLRLAGYQVEILTNVERPKDHPDGVDIWTLPHGADAILHLQLNDVGIYSGLFSGTYAPRVTTYGLMVAKGRTRALYDAEVHYGAHAEKGKDWAVEADARYVYTSPDEIISKAEELRAVFAIGSAAAGKRMTELMLAKMR